MDSDQSADETRLTHISTRLSRLFQPGQPGHDEFLRYYGAAFRYFRALVRDADAAEDLTHNFAQRYFQGDFQRYDPGKGRFRDFLKVALRHMAIDYLRVQKKGPQAALPLEDVLAKEEESLPFESACHEELLHQAWKSLARLEAETGKPHHTALRFKTEHPELQSNDLAAELSKLLRKTLAADAARQIVHRAREAFQEILLDEVARTLGSFSLDQIEAELTDLKLLPYCQAALNKRRGEKR